MNNHPGLFGGVEIVDGEEKPEFVLGRGSIHEMRMRWPQAELPLQQHYTEVDALLIGLRIKFTQQNMHAQCAIIDGIRGLFCLAAFDIERLQSANAKLEERLQRLEALVPGGAWRGGVEPPQETPEFVDATADDEDPA